MRTNIETLIWDDKMLWLVTRLIELQSCIAGSYEFDYFKANTYVYWWNAHITWFVILQSDCSWYRIVENGVNLKKISIIYA